jgi:hypothetical protein
MQSKKRLIAARGQGCIGVWVKPWKKEGHSLFDEIILHAWKLRSSRPPAAKDQAFDPNASTTLSPLLSLVQQGDSGVTFARKRRHLSGCSFQ